MGAKRICLFAGYNAAGKVDDCVFCYLRELQKFADICYFADGELPPADKEKLKEYTLAAYGARHGKYDFGSWAELMRLLGEEKLAEYDELILANDSCFGGFASFQPMFAEMEKRGLEAWGACGNHFIMSFFVVVGRQVFTTEAFRHLFANIKKEKNKSLIIKKYERGLDDLLQKHKCGIYFSQKEQRDFYNRHQRDMRRLLADIVPAPWRWLWRLHPQKINLYDENALLPLAAGFPLLKKNAFKNVLSFFSVYGEKLAAKISPAAAEAVRGWRQTQNILQPGAAEVLRRRLCFFAKSFIFEKKYKKDMYIIRICKIPVFRRKMNYTI